MRPLHHQWSPTPLLKCIEEYERGDDDHHHDDEKSDDDDDHHRDTDKDDDAGDCDDN